MKVPRTSSPINRVKCVVDSCAYHQTGDHCLAENIEVQHRHANTSGQTGCATFAPKD